MADFGNELNQIVFTAKTALFVQAELAQLSWNTFHTHIQTIKDSDQQEFVLHYPLGLRDDRSPIPGLSTYTKEQLVDRYEFLANKQLAVNGIYQLVSHVESMLSDVVRSIIVRFPKKVGGKHQIPLHAVLESATIKDMQIRAADHVLNELNYKSPREFAESIEKLISADLMSCSAYMRYIEVKATRDIFIHNRGVANEIYVRKASSHARCSAGQPLTVDMTYFLESYEVCLKLAEWLERELHDNWPSSELEQRNASYHPVEQSLIESK